MKPKYYFLASYAEFVAAVSFVSLVAPLNINE
jgi:hypothetical protein